jgi:TolB protein
MDADGTHQTRLTSNQAADGDPSWSPDGKRIAFDSDRDGVRRIWTMNADGATPALWPGSVSGDQQPSWSPDGKKIAFSRKTNGGRDIYSIDANAFLTQLTFNYMDAADPSWSEDGLQIAYSATYCKSESFYYYYDDCDVYVLLARTDGRILPSTPLLDRGYNPAWRR